MLDAFGVDPQHWDELKRLSRGERLGPDGLSQDNPNAILAAHAALGMGYDFAGFVDDGNNVVGRAPGGSLYTRLASKSNRSVVVQGVVDNRGRIVRHIPQAALRRALEGEADRQITSRGGVGSIKLIVPLPSRAAGKLSWSVQPRPSHGKDCQFCRGRRPQILSTRRQ